MKKRTFTWRFYDLELQKRFEKLLEQVQGMTFNEKMNTFLERTIDLYEKPQARKMYEYKKHEPPKAPPLDPSAPLPCLRGLRIYSNQRQVACEQVCRFHHLAEYRACKELESERKKKMEV